MGSSQNLSGPRGNTVGRTLYWYLSLRCNLACKHCWVKSSPSTDTSRDLSPKAALKAVKNVQEFSASVILTGGEPLYRPDFTDIFEALLAAGINVAMETNGLLISRQFAALAQSAKADGRRVHIAISLDGGTCSTHEWVRGNNTFNRTLSAMRLLTEHGLAFDVQCILHRSNAHAVPDLYRLMADFSPPPRNLIFGFLSPVGRGLQLSDEWALSDGERERACALILEGMQSYPGVVCLKTPPALIPPKYFPRLFSRQNQCRCSTGCSFPTLGILPNGDITLCALSSDNPSLHFGNVQTDSLDRIWNKMRMDEARARYREARISGICSDCIFLSMCKGSCRAFAYEEFGEFSAPYPLCDALEKRGAFPSAYRRENLAGATAAGPAVTPVSDAS